MAMNHYPDKTRGIAECEGYDLACYGHNHTLAEEKLGNTLLLNPGAIMGYHGGRLEEIPATFIVLDTATMEVKVHQL